MNNWTIAKIKAVMDKNGSYWWGPASMRHFRTQIESSTFEGERGIFFVTSEKPPRGLRKFTVREFNPKTLKISTVGDFCQMSRADAIQLASEKAREN